MKRRTKIGLGVAAGLLLLILAAVAWSYVTLNASLPDLEGNIAFEALQAPVRIERDVLGIPSIYAQNRLDAARATGFVHAQDRFFQMDFMRRNAAGELAEIMGGSVAFPDRRRRLHGFRHLAKTVFPSLPQEQQDLFTAYAEGVNLGLQELDSEPFEYYLLQADAEPWLPEDCLMVVYFMYLELKGGNGRHDFSLSVMQRLLPDPVFRFLVENGSTWESTLDGSQSPLIEVPDGAHFAFLKEQAGTDSAARPTIPEDSGFAAGSNAFALSGSHTSTGSAMVANDMHLSLGIPNVWYRAALHYPQNQGDAVRVTGATLPGLPFIVIGSNGHVVWAFTSAYVDNLDLAIVEPDPDDPDKYLTPDGPLPFEYRQESVEIKGAETMHQKVRMTIWGPAFEVTGFDKLVALKWAAHDPLNFDLGMHQLETVRDVETSFEILNRLSIPALHCVVGDSSGTVGYTLTGYLVDRENYDGMLPVSFADGTRVWESRLKPEDYPRFIDPDGGHVWSGNNRPLGETWRPLLGGGPFTNAARAHQIHRRLEALETATEASMLQIQMDNEAFFLGRWRELAMRVLESPEASSLTDKEELGEVLRDWKGRAAIDAPGYYLVKEFRDSVAERVLTRILKRCFETYDRFNYYCFDFEEPLWLLVTQQTEATADPVLGSWNAELAAAMKDTLTELQELWGDIPLQQMTWGKQNVIRINHPFSSNLPLIGSYLNMDPRSLPGDEGMPAVMTPFGGASQRMVVSPGFEESGIFHMPGGQSGHPLSPHYRDGHKAWEEGEPTPFLPGEPIHVLHMQSH